MHVARRSSPLESEASRPQEAPAPLGEPSLARKLLLGATLDPVISASLEPTASDADKRAALELLGERPIDLPNNRELRVLLRDLRLEGRIELADAAKIIAKTGKLSVAEERAIAETILAAELLRGVSPEAARAIVGHRADELALRAQDGRTSKIAAGAFSLLSAASGGLTASAATVYAGLSFGAEPISTAAMVLAGMFGIGSALTCANIAANRVVDASRYGVDD